MRSYIHRTQPRFCFLAHLAQEFARSGWTFDVHRHLHGADGEVLRKLMVESLPVYLYELDEKVLIKKFTVGFHVEARRIQ